MKLSYRHKQKLLKLSKRAKSDLNEVIRLMKDRVKKDPAIIEKFKEYDVPLDDIDNVHVEFCPLDVSAKTKDKKIYLNEKMLANDKDPESNDPTHYLVHELMHYLQQLTGKKCKGPKDANYLDKPTEEEAFQVQIDFKKRIESPDEADEYLEGLLSHHDLEGKERKEKKEDLLMLDD